MQKDQIIECTDLCRQYFDLSDIKQQEKRNEIWNIISPYMTKWVKTILSKRNNYLEEEEITSIGWDCFQFCLKHFKPDSIIPLPNHFYAYSKFYIAMNYLSKNNKIILVDLTNEMTNGQVDLAYEHLDELREFQKSLPDEYQVVFDDALMSMVDCRKDRLRRLDESPITYYRYSESKKIFKIIIDYLLRR